MTLSRRTLLSSAAIAAVASVVDPTPVRAGITSQARAMVSGSAGRTVHRAACIRLGTGGPRLLEDAAHGNAGISAVGVSPSGDLLVYTDFEPTREILIHAGISVDYTLGVRGVTAGVSGGGTRSLIRLVDRNGVRRPPGSGWFDIRVDNIWFHSVSLLRE